MKKTYTNPQLDCIQLNADVITASSNALTELDWALGEQISR